MVRAFFTFWKRSSRLILVVDEDHLVTETGEWSSFFFRLSIWGRMWEWNRLSDKKTFFAFVFADGGKKRKPTWLFSLSSHEKPLSLNMFIKSVWITITSQRISWWPQCNKERQVFQLCLVKRLIMRIRDE